MKRIGFLLIVLMSLAVGCSATASVDGWAIYEDENVYFEYPKHWEDITEEANGYVDIIIADMSTPYAPSVNLVKERTYYMLSASEVLDDVLEIYEAGLPGTSDFKLYNKEIVQVGEHVAGYLYYEVNVLQTEHHTEQIQIIIPRLNNIYYFTFAVSKGHFEDVADTFVQIIDTIKIK